MGKYIEMEKFALNIRKETLKMLLNRGFEMCIRDRSSFIIC